MLTNAEEGKEFKARNGEAYRNIYELAMALKSMDEATFMHHANSGKNDFATWVLDVFRKDMLSETLEKARTKEETHLALLREAVLQMADAHDSVAQLNQALRSLL